MLVKLKERKKMNKSCISIKDLDLSNATIIGFNGCSVSVIGSDIVCSDCFGRAVVKYPFDVNSRHRHLRGLPEEIGIDEDGNLEVWEIDREDEDYFGPEEQPIEILEGYSYVSTMYFTLVIKHN